MDKFGIFKLLSGLFNLNNQNSSAQDTPADGSEINSQNGLSGLADIFKSLSFPAPQHDEAQPGSPQQASKPQIAPPQAPLQSQMLFTMRSHDEFVKRVKNNNKK